MKVADRAGCPAWTIEDAPSWWIERYAIALAAETAANNERQARDERKRRMESARSGRRGR